MSAAAIDQSRHLLNRVINVICSENYPVDVFDDAFEACGQGGGRRPVVEPSA